MASRYARVLRSSTSRLTPYPPTPRFRYSLSPISSQSIRRMATSSTEATQLPSTTSSPPNSSVLRPSNSSLLDQLPPKPKRPAPLITQEQVDQYLVPHLYSNGWEIRVLRDLEPDSVEKGDTGNAGTVVTALSKRYSFKTFKATVAYFNDAVEIIKKEKHHPRSTIGYNQIRVTTWTHHASRPSASGSEYEICQGITAEDLILALRFDALYQEEKHKPTTTTAVADGPNAKGPYTPSSVDDVHRGPPSAA